MPKRFLDLHVHSKLSKGLDTRHDLERHAKTLGTDIRFCDGGVPEEGLLIGFQDKLNIPWKKAGYIIMESTGKETLSHAKFPGGRVILHGTLTPTLAKSIHKKGGAVEIRLSTLFNSTGVGRTRALRTLKTNLKYAQRYGVQMIATTGATSIYGLRSPYQAFELLRVIGLSEKEAGEAIYKNPLNLLEGL